ncbi:hypothetical protein C5C74_12210 [Rathayibacter sp. AY1E8]|nr:hypothetical protein C5C46_15285 [Rathayibacter sp. AY1E6]PPG16383.1 hypothetical protein C5C74_12210 [Rathayibacter sp. AY1E8]PPH84418.1 hypothetical protein C5C82_14385 [Rathayibacter sp. AY1D5]
MMTTLHRALGREPSPLTRDLIDEAIEVNLAESDNLDWKKSAPAAAGGDNAAREFAKDIAAMANASGGIIVMGVEEERGRGTAKAINDIDISEPELQRLRQWAGAHLKPVVAPLDVTPIPSADNAAVGQIAITIPASTNAPHFVSSSDNTLRAPVRYGTETRWLAEPELAHAYSKRFQTAASLSAQLEEGVAQAMHGLDRTKKTWLVGVARPEVGPGIDSTPLTSREFLDVLSEAEDRSTELVGAETFGSPLQWASYTGSTQRLGLRRRIFEDRRTNDVASVGESIRVELHDDGTIALCVDAFQSNPVNDGRAYVQVEVVEGFARDLVGLVEARSKQQGRSGRYVARVDMLAAQKFPPGLRAHGPDRHGDHGLLEGSREVLEPIPILTTIEAGVPTSERLVSARSIATDLLHQFSFGALFTFPKE